MIKKKTKEMDFLGGAESQKTESSPKSKLVGSKHYALSSRVALKPISTTGNPIPVWKVLSYVQFFSFGSHDPGSRVLPFTSSTQLSSNQKRVSKVGQFHTRFGFLVSKSSISHLLHISFFCGLFTICLWFFSQFTIWGWILLFHFDFGMLILIIECWLLFLLPFSFIKLQYPFLFFFLCTLYL